MCSRMRGLARTQSAVCRCSATVSPIDLDGDGAEAREAASFIVSDVMAKITTDGDQFEAHHMCFTQRQLFEHFVSDGQIGDVDATRI
jgi:hypothetical protein